MPWVVLQMCIRSSQASTVWRRVSIRSALPCPAPWSTAAAGRESSMVGVEISVTLRQLVVWVAALSFKPET